MTTVEILTLVLSGLAIIGTLIGWTVEHHLSRKRDFANKKKEMKTAYLIEAFRCIENASNRTDYEHKVLLEKALADIQLFGSEEQIKLVKELATEFVKTKKFMASALLTSLRNDLRNELELSLTNEDWLILRLEKPKQKKKTTKAPNQVVKTGNTPGKGDEIIPPVYMPMNIKLEIDKSLRDNSGKNDIGRSIIRRGSIKSYSSVNGGAKAKVRG